MDSFDQPRLFIEPHPHTEYVIIGCGASVEYVKEVDFAAKRENGRLLNVFAHIGYGLPAIDYYARGARFFPDPQNNDAVVVFSRSCVAAVSRGELLRGGTICSERVVEFGTDRDIQEVAIVGKRSIVIMFDAGISLLSMQWKNRQFLLSITHFTPYSFVCEHSAILVHSSSTFSFSCFAASNEQFIYAHYVHGKQVVGHKSELRTGARSTWLSARLTDKCMHVYIGSLVSDDKKKKKKKTTWKGYASHYRISLSDPHRVEWLPESVYHYQLSPPVRSSGIQPRPLHSAPVDTDSTGTHYFTCAGRVFAGVMGADRGVKRSSVFDGLPDSPPLLDCHTDITAIRLVNGGRHLLIGCATGRLLRVDVSEYRANLRAAVPHFRDDSPDCDAVDIPVCPGIDWLRMETPRRVVAVSYARRAVYCVDLDEPDNTCMHSIMFYDYPSKVDKVEISYSPRLGYTVRREEPASIDFHVAKTYADMARGKFDECSLEFAQGANHKVISLNVIGADWLVQDAHYNLRLHMGLAEGAKIVDITPEKWLKQRVKNAFRVSRSASFGFSHIVVLLDGGRVFHILYKFDIQKGTMETQEVLDEAQRIVDISVGADQTMVSVCSVGLVKYDHLQGSHVGLNGLNSRVEGRILDLWSPGAAEKRQPLALYKVRHGDIETTLLAVHAEIESSQHELELWDVRAEVCCRVAAVRLPPDLTAPDSYSLAVEADASRIHVVLAAKKASAFGAVRVLRRSFPRVTVSSHYSLSCPHYDVQDIGGGGGGDASPFRASICRYKLRVSMPAEPTRSHLMLSLLADGRGAGEERPCVALVSPLGAVDDGGPPAGPHSLFYSYPGHKGYLNMLNFRRMDEGLVVSEVVPYNVRAEIRSIETSRCQPTLVVVLTHNMIWTANDGGVWQCLSLPPRGAVAVRDVKPDREGSEPETVVALDRDGNTWMYMGDRSEWMRIAGAESHAAASCLESLPVSRGRPWVAIGERTGAVHIVSIDQSKTIATIRHHAAAVRAVEWFSSGRVVAVIDESTPTVVLHKRMEEKGEYAVLLRVALGCPLDSRFFMNIKDDRLFVKALPASGGLYSTSSCDCDREKIRQALGQ